MPLKTRSIVTFDRNIIKKNWQAINESPAKKAGLMVRKRAISSIRKTPKLTKKGKPTKPSKSGKPPRSRAPGHPLRRIYSVPDRFGASVVVGALGFGKGSEPTPGVHELGLRAQRRVLVPADTQGRSRRGRFQRKKKVLKTVQVDFPERPFMAPALEKVQQKLPQLWKNSLSKG